MFLVSSMEGGGAERVAALLSNQWARDGHDVVLMPTFSGRGGCSYPIESTVTLRFLADETKSLFSRTPIGRLWALRRVIRKTSPDIVVSFLTNVNVAAILASGDVPVVISERIYPPRMPTGFFWRIMRKITYAQADRVVMQTKEGLAWLKAVIPAARGILIANPVVVPVRGTGVVIVPADVVPTGNKILLSAGRLDPQKNFQTLILAFADLIERFPDWRLVILGDGVERSNLEALVARAGLEAHVLLPGHVGNLDDWFRSAQAFALTSSFEGFPNALLEALAYGVPSFALDCPTGPSEMIEQDANGLLGSAGSTVLEVASAIARLLEKRWDDRLTASAKIRATYGIEAISREWTELFQQLHTGRRRNSVKSRIR